MAASGGTTAAAEAALIGALADGKAYFNLHTTAFGGGEIRGFFVPVPEPSATALVGAGLLGAFALSRRRRENATRPSPAPDANQFD